MNIKSLREFNRFKKEVASGKEEGWQDEIARFAEIKNAEDMEVTELLKAGKKILLIGTIDKKFSNRPIVCHYPDGDNYPKLTSAVLFKQMDLMQDIVELQDTIDIVSDPKGALKMIEESAAGLTLLNVETVYGKSLKKTGKFFPQLTLAEVVSQLAPRYGNKKVCFYVCATPEDGGTLASYGYHAYRVAVYEAEGLPADKLPDLSIDGLFSV